MSMDMFEEQEEPQAEPPPLQQAPLATRMRPNALDGFVGQEHILAKGRVLRKLIESDRVPSMIFWGPPGCGKTTLAFIIASSTGAHFAPVSAVSASVADLRRIIVQARERRKVQMQRTILFIDEIHHFNKTQQDAVLPFVEDGTVILIGATTENPSFEVTSPLLSRTRVLPLKPLSEEEIQILILRALRDTFEGIGELSAQLDADAMNHLITAANHDARVALNTLETAAMSTPPNEEGKRVITLATIEDVFQRRAVIYDKGGDRHYDNISALHKSLRGSSINCDLNPTSFHLINARELLLMKPTAVLINTARGSIVNEPALVRALQQKQIAGAALDVFEEEPLPEDSPLRQMDNVLLAPHNANSSPEAWEHVHHNTIRNLLKVLEKEKK